ncbi:MAG: uracil-DNA glycosylase [Clostridia bacterium]|nr:uracil-DNA glycosylase [Clostridia bacterium]
MTKRDRLNILYEKYKEEFEGNEIVLGDGNPDAELLLIGEAPGKDEVKLGKPFVGTAGRNLNEFLGILGVDRTYIYISNAIKYRLSKTNPKSDRTVNRPATTEEIKMNRQYLLNEIGIIKPGFIVTLGNVPLRAVTGNLKTTIGSVHGEVGFVHIGQAEYKLFPLYHPASVIYNRSLRDIYICDIKKLKSYINTLELKVNSTINQP